MLSVKYIRQTEKKVRNNETNVTNLKNLKTCSLWRNVKKL